MQTRALGSDRLEVSEHGLACMGLSYIYGPAIDKAGAIRLIRTAYDKGVTFFGTAEAYGTYANGELLGEAVAPFRKSVVVATKFGFSFGPDGRQSGLISKPNPIKIYAMPSIILGP